MSREHERFAELVLPTDGIAPLFAMPQQGRVLEGRRHQGEKGQGFDEGRHGCTIQPRGKDRP